MLDMKKMQQDPCYEESLKDFKELSESYLKELGYGNFNAIKGEKKIAFYDEVERRQQELKKERSSDYLTIDELDKKYDVDTSEEDAKEYQALIEVEEEFMKLKGYTEVWQIDRMSIEWEEYAKEGMEKRGFRHIIWD